MPETARPPAKATRPTLEEFRRELGRVAAGMTDAELLSLQNQIEWFARFAVEQTLAARAARDGAALRKSA